MSDKIQLTIGVKRASRSELKQSELSCATQLNCYFSLVQFIYVALYIGLRQWRGVFAGAQWV